MTISDTDRVRISAEFSDIINPSWKGKALPLAVLAIALLYLVYLFNYFEFSKIGDRWHSDRAALFALDSYAYKVHVDTKWKDTDRVQATLEGSRWERYKELPGWIEKQGKGVTKVGFGDDGFAVVYPDRVEINFVGNPTITVPKPIGGKISATSTAELPSWIRVSKSKVDARPTQYTRIQVYKSKITIHRYFVGWAHFWFDFQSPLADYGFLDAMNAVFFENRIDPSQSNLSLVASEFWNNKLWFHRDVWIALVQTIFMAVMGTLFAAILGLPLAFLAAYNVTPFAPVRMLMRRLFDTLRGIDTLIWSLIFIRAFGMGPFSGLLAIGITDTGTLGKLMSEAIENTDKKQVEGVQSTGANKVQQHRFGILPQILPLFISQTLYYLESNTRGAVIIGAMGAGGIGLQFLGAMQTGTDWENVAYISIIVLVTVILMDMLSARLRRMLIQFQ